MKKILLVGIAALLLIHATPVALAEDTETNNRFTKFGRGVANIVISPMEFFTQPVLMSEDHEPAIAIFGGLLKGAGMFLAREGVGIYEVLTFPFAGSHNYGPIITPATTFTDWDERKPQA